MEMTSKFLCVSNGLFEQASMLVRPHDLENQPKKIIGANYIDLSLIPKRKWLVWVESLPNSLKLQCDFHRFDH